MHVFGEPGRRRVLTRQVLPLGAVAALLTGCSAEYVDTGWLPTERGTTDKVDQVINLWNGSWIAGLAIGAVVWVLILAAAVIYRRRRQDDPLPAQWAYNVPLEITYTIIPLLMIGVFFAYTFQAQEDLEQRSDNPDLKVHVIGKQWAWDFNYTSDDVYDTTVQLQLDGSEVPEHEMPTLYLPVNQQVEIKLDSRDVIHSFWVPSFLYKKDMIPGQTNYWTFTPQREGTFAGKCAELCGEYHSEMLFNVKVVPQAEYDEHMQMLRDKGQTGELGLDGLDRKSKADLAKEQAAESDHADSAETEEDAAHD